MGRLSRSERVAHRDDLTADKVLAEFLGIHTAPAHCRNGSVSILKWECAVHYPLFKLALTGYREREDI